jgi:hypothetical protein
VNAQLKGRILTAQMVEDLAWMGEQEEVDAFVAKNVTHNADAVSRLRERQSAQRAAQNARISGTSLNDRESQWLFRDAVITEIPV